MIYGDLHIKVELDTTDRVGLRTLVLSQKWQPSKWPISDPELDDERPGIPAVSGAMILIGVENRDLGNAIRTFWTFGGVRGDGKSVTFKDRSTSFDYAFQPGFEQTDIRKHPRIRELLDRHEGVLDPSSLEIVWPLTVAGGSTGSKSGFRSGASGGGEKQNPMFGRNDWLQTTGTYTFRYLSFSPPSDARAGRIVKGGLPGRAPSFSDRDWLQAPSPYKCIGIVYDITEIYLLSGSGGWPAPIHNLLGTSGGGDANISTFGGGTRTAGDGSVISITDA